MPAPQKGDRVGAVASVQNNVAKLFGYGTYEGDEIPPPEIIGPFGPVTTTNPKIKLDNGDIVWGCECWWSPENLCMQQLQGLTIVDITVAEYRNR